MTGVVITSLPTASTLTGAEYVPVVQSGTTVKTPVNSWSYTPAGTGAVTTTVQSKLRETVSVKDFGAVGDGVTDDTTAIQNANTASFNKDLFFPSGTYVLTSDITFQCNVVMELGAQIVTSNKLIFSKGFEAPLFYCLNASGFVQFINVDEIYPQWFGAMGDAVFARGTINSGSTSLAVSSPGGLSGGANGFTNGDTIFINGAGSGGSVLSATVVSGGGTGSIVISTPALTSVSGKSIASRDDTVALQRFFASVKSGMNTVKYGTNQPSTNGANKLYVPFGTYCSFDEIICYGGTLIQGEFVTPPTGARIVHCNIAKPLITVIADNYDSNGNSINGGNNSNIIKDIGFSGAEINDSITNPPVIKYQYAWNQHSDCELDHVLWQNTAGACVGGGFQTTGSINSGSTTLTLADGSVFRNGNYGGGKITIVGAGVAGANLDTYIVSGGGTNTVTVATAASTTVTNATVYPQTDIYSIKVNDCEMDVCRAGFDFVGNSSGSLVINNLLAFWVVRGAIRIFSAGSWELVVTDSYFDGCGNPSNATDLTWRNGIVVESIDKEGSLFIDSCIFTKSGSFGGRIFYEGDNFTIRNSQFTNIDSSYIEKFIKSKATQTVIQNNYFLSSSLVSYTNARLIALSNASATLVKITSNTFENTNASSFDNFIQSDFNISVCEINENTFKGNVTSVLNANISQLPNMIVLNSGYNPKQRYGSAAPTTTGPWAVGDIVWNNTPASAGYVGWICTTAGTPGTWKTFGLIS